MKIALLLNRPDVATYGHCFRFVLGLVLLAVGHLRRRRRVLMSTVDRRVAGIALRRVSGSAGGGRCQQQRLVAALNGLYGIEVVSLGRIEAGTATDNYVASGRAGRRWFVKVYRDPRTLPSELEAIELAMFARAGGVPVPAVHRTLGRRTRGGPHQ